MRKEKEKRKRKRKRQKSLERRGGIVFRVPNRFSGYPEPVSARLQFPGSKLHSYMRILFDLDSNSKQTISYANSR